MSRYLFVTGKLAEPALRQVLADLVPRAKIEAEVAVLPITVAALLTTPWISSHLKIPERIDQVILPGLCTGEMNFPWPQPTERGPKDLRDLPEHFGLGKPPRENYGVYDIEILAEINHASRLPLEKILQHARQYRESGADLIDVGCDPGSTWMELEIAVQALREEGFRVSIDSFNPDEVEMGLAAGAECILSVNSSNLNKVRDWQDRFGAFEVVVLPDSPKDLPTLYPLVEKLHKWNQRFRIDPILEPIGMGFAESLGRYLQVRQRYPEAEILMGIGNLTELTDVDSAGLNVMLAGFCQELGIRSVLTTEVINWSRSSVKEFDIARRLMHYAVKNKTVPKRIENQLVMLRDPKVHHLGEEGLRDLAERITDSNYRLFVEAGEIHVINGKMHLRGKDPFDIFEDMMKLDSKLDASHSFYLGYEMAKMVTAMTLNKNYTQDQALSWGFLTVPEISHR